MAAPSGPGPPDPAWMSSREPGAQDPDSPQGPQALQIGWGGRVPGTHADRWLPPLQFWRSGWEGAASRIASVWPAGSCGEALEPCRTRPPACPQGPPAHHQPRSRRPGEKAVHLPVTKLHSEDTTRPMVGPVGPLRPR